MTAPARSTVVYVAYRTATIDMAWIPGEANVIVVHNDDSMDVNACTHPGVRHVRMPSNVGFGAGVNAALPLVHTERVILCNPDTALCPEHWTSLNGGGANHIGSVALVDADGRSTSVVNRYPTPLSLLLSGYRIGRWLRRDGRVRTVLEPFLGRWGRTHAALRQVGSGSWPITDHWVSGALLSIDVERLRAVGGFDGAYFLYVEDLDLCARLAARFPGMRIVMEPCRPGIHAVAGSSRGRQGTAERHHLTSVRRYARGRSGLGWRVTAAALAPRSLAMARHQAPTT